MKNVPLAFHPTKVLLLDDDPLFLESIKTSLALPSAHFQSFSSPKMAADFLNTQYTTDPFVRRFINPVPSKNYQQQSINVNILNLYKEIQNPKRFNEISVIVVDYNMPGMNGLEFCSQINNKKIQKILLTGEADAQTAINAFNAGLINQYIQKQDRNAISKLHNAICECQYSYFSNLLTYNALTLNPDEPSALELREFQIILQSTLSEYNAIEFYIFEQQGSFFFFDPLYHPQALFIRTRDQLNAFLMEAKDEPLLPKSLLADLKSYQKTLCFPCLAGSAYPDPEDWEQYIHPISPLDSQRHFYYAIVKDIPNLDLSSLVPFSPVY